MILAVSEKRSILIGLSFIVTV